MFTFNFKAQSEKVGIVNVRSSYGLSLVRLIVLCFQMNKVWSQERDQKKDKKAII